MMMMMICGRDVVGPRTSQEPQKTWLLGYNDQMQLSSSENDDDDVVSLLRKSFMLNSGQQWEFYREQQFLVATGNMQMCE